MVVTLVFIYIDSGKEKENEAWSNSYVKTNWNADKLFEIKRRLNLCKTILCLFTEFPYSIFYSCVYITTNPFFRNLNG